MSIDSPYAPVSLLKRLMAIFYDLFLLIGIFFIVGISVSILTTFIFNDGNAITEEHPYYILNRVIILLTLFMSSLMFYGWFWTHGGQTLGMKTWRIKLIAESNAEISWKLSVIRFLSAALSWCLFGLGFIWCLFDKDKKSWHDHVSKTYLVQLEKKS